MAPGEAVIEIVLVKSRSEADLLEIIRAKGSFRFGFGAGKRRQQQGGKDGNNGDDNEQLDERKPKAFGCSPREGGSERKSSRMCQSISNASQKRHGLFGKSHVRFG